MLLYWTINILNWPVYVKVINYFNLTLLNWKNYHYTLKIKSIPILFVNKYCVYYFNEVCLYCHDKEPNLSSDSVKSNKPTNKHSVNFKINIVVVVASFGWRTQCRSPVSDGHVCLLRHGVMEGFVPRISFAIHHKID